VPLSANYPRDGERLAVYFVLAAQAFSAAALMPWLLRGWRMAALTAFSSWPLLAVAATLSATPTRDAVAAGAYTALWISTLSIWVAATRGPRAAFAACAAFATVAAGGPLLWYLRGEFGAGANPGAPWQYGPVVSAFSLASGSPASQSGWWQMALVVGAGLALLLAPRTLRSHRSASTH
jgi:hypothetical protein